MANGLTSMKDIISVCCNPRRAFSWTLTFFLSLSCVSVDLPQKKTVPAKNLSWTPPSRPFVANELPQADQAWQVPSDGSTLSFHSDCNKTNESSLDEVLTNLMGALEDRTLLHNERIIFNGRTALKAQIKGTVDGVKTQLAVLVFRKNNCLYNLTYAALEEHFLSHLRDFEKFLTDFKVP